MAPFRTQPLGSLSLLCALSAYAAGPSIDIKVDQAGYLPNLSKMAAVANHTDAHTFTLRRSPGGEVVFKGQLSAPVLDKDSGDNVQTADFTSVHDTGAFYVEVPGVGQSWEFKISPDVYDHVYYLAMRSYYGQRCGTAVDLGPDYPQYKHAICHTNGVYDPSSGKTGPHSSAKGWHDAGDYGRYVVNGGISTGTLLWTWDLYSKSVGSIGLKIPESGGATPDLLSEVRWNLDWMLSMQDVDGGVFHKQTSTHFCGFIMPEADKLPSVVVGTGQQPFKSSCATADVAAVAAIGARLFQPYDSAYAKQLRTAAAAAWVWLQTHPNVTFRNPKGITTGDYGDSNCQDEALWAAVSLWQVTKAPQYEQYFLAHYRDFLQYLRPLNPQSWSQVAPLALWGYVLAGGSDRAAVSTIRDTSLAAADAIAARAGQHPYRISLTTADYIWGSNAVALNYSMQLLIADRLRPDKRYVAAALDNLHYILGRNAFSISWITHVGQNSVQHPHHRPSGSGTVIEPWPGLMSGGPNRGRQDNVMKRSVSADTAPAKCYIDITGAYACNEVAINWNAPLVFTLAAAVSLQSH